MISDTTKSHHTVIALDHYRTVRLFIFIQRRACGARYISVLRHQLTIARGPGCIDQRARSFISFMLPRFIPALVHTATIDISWANLLLPCE